MAPHATESEIDIARYEDADLQQELAARETQIPIIFLTGHGDIPMSVRTIKSGAVEKS